MATRTLKSTLIMEGWYSSSLFRADLRQDDDGRFFSVVNLRTNAIEGEGVNEILMRNTVDNQTEVLQAMLDDASMAKCKLS